MSAAAASLSIIRTPTLRLALPLVDDFGYLARRMRPDEIEQFLAVTGATDYHSDTAARVFAAIPGHAYAIVGADNRPVMAGGFEPIRPGVYEVWGAGTIEGWEKHWRAITLICNRLIRDLLAGPAHRVQTCALASRTQAHEWYERGLRMKPEGRHPGFFADGQAGISYARTRST